MPGQIPRPVAKPREPIVEERPVAIAPTGISAGTNPPTRPAGIGLDPVEPDRIRPGERPNSLAQTPGWDHSPVPQGMFRVEENDVRVPRDRPRLEGVIEHDVRRSEERRDGLEGTAAVPRERKRRVRAP
jgi:hypothetical protein